MLLQNGEIRDKKKRLILRLRTSAKVDKYDK